jgi:amino acid transporter
MAGVFEDQESSTKTGSRYTIEDVPHLDVEDQPHTPQLGSPNAVIPDNGQIVTQYERQSLIRGLGQRHIQMIAIAGAIVCKFNWNMEFLANRL